MRRAVGGAVVGAMLCVGIATALPAQAASTLLTRSPYLTDVVGSVATVNWATLPSTSAPTVTYGVSGGGCADATATVAAPRSITVGGVSEDQFTAQLTGLASATSYCYRISQGGADLIGAPVQFTSAVAAGSTTPFTFAVLGDWGEATSGTNDHQARVLRQVADSGAQFALGTGDIGYPDGTDTQYGDLQGSGGNSEVFGPGFWGVPGGSIPMFTAVGNHGWNATFWRNWPQPTAVASSNGSYSGRLSSNDVATWYAFDEGNARFYVLEAATSTGAYSDDDAAHWVAGSAERTWLRNDLAAHPGSLKFAVFHYPIYSDDAYSGSDSYLQQDLQPILDQYGVRVAFNGHSHIYQRNKPDGSGMVTYVSGGAGADTVRLGTCSTIDAYAIGWEDTVAGSGCGDASSSPPTAESQVHHFLKVTVDGTTVTVRPTDEDGNVFDQQTYDFAPSAPTALQATPGDSHVAMSWSAPSSAGGSAVSRYTVYRATSPSAAGSAVATGVTGTSYDDTSAAAGTTYYYSVSATNAAGLTGPPTSPVSATAYTKPAAPTNLTATPADAQVSLSWTAPASNGSPVTTYTVYRSKGGGAFTAVGSPTTTTYTDTGPTNGTSYSYEVTATNAAGESAASSQVSATPYTKPAAPTNLTATPANAQVALSWTAPASNGSPITTYTVYRSTGRTAFIPIGSPGTTSYSDTGLTNGTPYSYQVTATNAAGESVASSQVTATPLPAPGAPAHLVATASDAQVSLSWSAPTDPGGSSVSSYTVYRSNASGIRGAALASTAGTGYADTGLSNGTTYYYSVTATNSTGEGVPATQQATPCRRPDAPVDVTANAGNGDVHLTWTVPVANGSAIASYTVYRSTDGTTFTPLGSTTTASYTDTGLHNGTAYTYQVSATNAAGEGPASIVATATPYTTPDAPTGLSAAPGDGSVDLTWTAPASGGSPVTGYTVLRSVDGTAFTTIGSSSTTGYRDTGLADGTTYTYEVRATNAAGVGVASSAVTATPRTVPGAPGGVTASGADGSVTLDWDGPSYDGGDPVSGFTVYRSTTPGDRGSAIATTRATSYTDTQVTDGTTYYYAVTATNVAGEGSASAQVGALPHGGATVTITGGPSSPTRSSAATFTFTTSDPNAMPTSTTCRLDDGEPVGCASGQVFSGLTSGSHRLQVTASDATGTGATAGYTWTVDRDAPTVAVRALGKVTLQRTTIRWAGTDTGVGIASYDVRLRRAGRDGRFGAWHRPAGWQAISSTSAARTDARGATTCYSVRARDRAGNVGRWSAPTCTTRPLDDRGLTASASWKRQHGPAYFAMTVTSSSVRGATLRVGPIGVRQVALVVTRCPTCGTVRVLVGTHVVATRSLRSAHQHRRAVLLLPSFARRSSVLTIEVVSATGTVAVDGVAALP